MILNETSVAWRDLQSFRRDPTHLTKDLPWTFKDILRNLGLAEVSILPFSPPIIDSSSPPFIDAHAAYGNRNQRPPTPSQHIRQCNNNNNNKIGTQVLSNPPRCRLCNNGHPNPWHTEDTCPFKDPTHILC